MANYIYKTSIYHDTTGVIGVPGSNTADLADFVANHMGTCLPVTNVQVAETSFELDKTYTQFDALVDTPYSWSDVKCITTEKAHQLYLITSNPI